MPHVRDGAAGALDAIDEFVRVAELVGSPQLLDNLLYLVEDAAQRVDLTFDEYPYGAGNTLLTALLPPWAPAGGPDAIVRRLGEPQAPPAVLPEFFDFIPNDPWCV